MSWEPLATADPIPGDPEVSRRAAVHYGDVATAMGEADVALGVIEKMDGFRSEAVEALRSKAEDVRSEVTKAQSRYDAVAGALRIYAARHEEAQDAARDLLDRAREAQDRLDSAESAASTAQSHYDDGVLAGVRAVDERAMADGQAWGAGVWFPEKNGHLPTASVLVRTFADRGDPHKAFRKTVKRARKVPRIPGVTVSGYSATPHETENGPALVQALDSTDNATGVMLFTWRVTFFPYIKDEVVEIECDTPYSHLVDDVDEEFACLIENSIYSIVGYGE